MSIIALLTLSGCTGDDVGSTPDTAHDTAFEAPATYAFTTSDGASSVSYAGQVFRHVLIADLKAHLGEMTGRLDTGSWYPQAGDARAELEFYLDFDSAAYGQVPLGIQTDPATLQTVYDDLSTDKDLIAKLAGNDELGQHADWSTDFIGWEADAVTTPESLVRLWVGTIDAQALDWVAGDYPLGPSGSPVPAVYVTPEGQDLRQLLDKLLTGAIAYSQATDDYLDDDIVGKGLLSDHSSLDESGHYSDLEHSWDEAFGYFGASRTYGAWSDDEIADLEYRDIDGDGAIDLSSEICFGHSLNVAKRDRGANAPVDWTAQAWSSFIEGRALLSNTAGDELSPTQLSTLQGHRDQAVDAWERAIAASAIHYVNETLQDIAVMGTEDYAFEDHAKHWSELKGFALALQFNPRAQIDKASQAELHALIGVAPVLATSGMEAVDEHADALRLARTTIADAYGFDQVNLGDDDGNGGW